MKVQASSILYDEQFNCRGKVLPSQVADLARLIQSAGLISPVTIRPLRDERACFTYQLIAGHRRFIATTQLLGWSHIEAVVVDCTDEQAARINLMENLGRQDLTPGQELDGILRTYGDNPVATEVAKDLGKSVQWVRRRLAIRKLDDSVRHSFWDGGLSAFDLSILISCPLDEQGAMMTALLEAKQEGLSSSSVAKRKGKLRRPRSRGQIQEMITRLLDEDIEPTAWRALAWAAGTINDDELLELT